MKCSDVKILLSPYLDGETTAEESRMINDHLSVCETCQAQLEDMRNLSVSLHNTLFSFVAPERMEERIVLRIAALRQTQRMNRLMAAIFAIVFGAVTIVTTGLLLSPFATILRTLLRLFLLTSRGIYAFHTVIGQAEVGSLLMLCIGATIASGLAIHRMLGYTVIQHEQ